MLKEIKLLPIQKKLYSSEKEFAGIYSSRSTGKTYILSWLITLAVIRGEKSLAFSQTYKSLTQNLFQEIMSRFRELDILPDYNKSTVTISYNGGVVYGYSYDSAESTRGQTNVQNLFLDELALAGSDLLAIVGPCLRGQGIKPRVRFCSTPRTSSYWNRIVKEHLRIGDWDIFTGTYRKDKCATQTCLYNSINCIDFYDTRLKAFRCAVMALIKDRLANTKTAIQKRLERGYDSQNKEHNGLCESYDTIQHYLNTPYTKVKGNGDSATSLFKAVRTCMKYNDNVTLEKVLSKARSEHWSEKELEHIQSNMHKYIE